MKFKVGQEITPIKQEHEWKILVGLLMPIPMFGKIYTVRGYPLPTFSEMLELEEFTDEGRFVYHEECFEALVPGKKILEDLEEIMTTE